MPWTPTIPPAPVKPAVTGWWALLKSLASNSIAVQDAATVIGKNAAAQTLSPTDAAAVKGQRTAAQTLSVIDAAAVKGIRPAPQQFSILDAASLKGAPVANDSLFDTWAGNWATDPDCSHPSLWAGISPYYTAEVTSEQAYAGTTSVKVVKTTDVPYYAILSPLRNPANGASVTYDPVVPGQQVTMTGRMRRLPGNSHQVNAFVRFRDASNAIMAGASYNVKTLNDDTWQEYVVTNVAPAGAVNAESGFYINNTLPTGSGFYLDAIEYRKTGYLSGTATPVGIALTPQQVSLLNAGTITGTIASATGQQIVPIANGATIKGIRAAGQSFTVVNGATLRGKPGASQLLAITESGAVKGISAANVSFIITNTGTVYARLTGAQSFTVNDGASWYGKPGAAQSFSVTNAATVYQIANAPQLDAQSATQKFNSATGAGYTFSHTATAGAAVIVAIVNASTWQPSSVTYGGADMALVTEINIAAIGRVEVYALNNVPGGAQTVKIVHNLANQATIAVAISYTNVAFIGTATSSQTYGTVSQSATVDAGYLALQVIGTASGVFTTSSGGTQRVFDNNGTTGLIFRDSEASTTFEAGGSSQYYAQVGLALRAPAGVPSFDAASNGDREANINTQTGLSWTQAVAQNNSDIYVALTCSASFGTAAACDGSAMTEVASQALNNVGSTGYLRIYRITGIAAGSHTLTAGPSGGNFMAVSALSAVYTGVYGVGTPTTVFGTDATPGSPPTYSQTVTPGVGERVLHVFGQEATGIGLSSYIDSQSGGNHRAAHANDLSGNNLTAESLSDTNTSVTFTAVGNASGGALHWAGIALPLIG